ncbi:Asp-tRNA(Asn)/Glu-tRNA(Gln) amidotransferase subunit GatC [Candidatus Foliamicus sp.]
MNNLQTPKQDQSAEEFSDADLLRVARLTRLALEDGEKRELADALRRIIGFVRVLQELDTEGVEPMVHPLDLTLPLRPDQVTEPDMREAAQACAPDVAEGLYRVPKVIDRA